MGKQNINKLTLLKLFFIWIYIFLNSLKGYGQYQVFDFVKTGDFESLVEMPTASFNNGIRNQDGYTPLQWLILHYVDYDLDKYYGDDIAMGMNVQKSDAYRSCLRYLLDNGASEEDLSPAGYNAIQLAVVHGKWGPTNLLLDRLNNKSIRDPAGNTLLHLSTLANHEMTIAKFWEYLIDKLRSDGVNRSSLNYAGQTPIAYFFSSPHQLSNNNNNLIDALKSPESLKVKDFSGKTAMDYAEMNNSWAVFTLNLYLNSSEIIQQEWDEINKKLQAQIDENNRLLEEYERRMEGGEGVKTLNTSFTETYYKECNVNYKGELYGSNLQESVTITVTPDMVWVSSLEPYYGGFKVESSGYEMVGNEKWEVYYFEKSANNSTYLGIGFPVNINHKRVMFKTSNGFEGLCQY